MKYAVIANLILNLPTQANTLADDILTRIANKPTWGTVGIGKGTDMEGNPQTSAEVRFDNRADMDDLFAFIKSRMDTTPVLRGKVSWHECSHDTQPVPCVISGQYIK